MKLNGKTIIIIVLCFVVAFVSINATKAIYEGKVAKVKRELKNYKIRNDSLTKVSEGHYKKLVADTLTKKQLRQKVDSLELKVKKPIIITKTEYKFKDIETEGSIKQTDSTMFYTDYYPQKENPFIVYQSNVNKIKETFEGSFTLNPISIDFVFSQNEDGTYQLDTKLPDFISVTSIDIESIPLEETFISEKTFTTFAGLKYNHTFTSQDPSVEVMFGARYRKINLIGSLNTNSYLGLGFLIDF